MNRIVKGNAGNGRQYQNKGSKHTESLMFHPLISGPFNQEHYSNNKRQSQQGYQMGHTKEA
jgi:hypothetical protein